MPCAPVLLAPVQYIDLIDVDRKSAPCILAPSQRRELLGRWLQGVINAYGAPLRTALNSPDLAATR